MRKHHITMQALLVLFPESEYPPAILAAISAPTSFPRAFVFLADASSFTDAAGRKFLNFYGKTKIQLINN